MSKNSNHKFEILSGIATDIIDKYTAKRAKLLAKVGKKPFFTQNYFKIAMAAILFLAIGTSLIWIFMSGGKQVPVYLGMTVSGKAPTVEAKVNQGNTSFTLMDYPTLADGNSNLAQQSETDDESGLTVNSAAPIYNANQNEDFYITVHIDNPDNFEIISFTLNDKKYSSYMFEEGSDMEHIILKCNAGNEIGVFEYTIDAIKYIDGTTIKDVQMDGEQTIQIAVDVTDLFIVDGFFENRLNSAYVDFTLINRYNILRDDQMGRFYIKLSTRRKTLELLDITVGEPFQYTFEDLQIGQEYFVDIYGEFDGLDGYGLRLQRLYHWTISPDELVNVNFQDVDLTSAHCSINIPDELMQIGQFDAALYLGDRKVMDVVDFETTFEDLYTNTTYTVRIECNVQGETGTIEFDFTTQLASVEIECTATSYSLHTVGGSFAISDTFHNSEIIKVELCHKGRLIDTIEGESTVLFEYLDFPLTYEMKVIYSCDLKDGKGRQVSSQSYQIATQSEGLKISDGMIVDNGTNKDSVLYLNMPIGPDAFRSSNVKKIVFGEGVTSIGANAFSGCGSLTEVVFSDNLKTIGEYAFYYCNFLQEINLPESLESIGTSAFKVMRYNSTFDHLIIPAGVKEISFDIVDPEVIVFTKVEQIPQGWDAAFHSGTTVWGCEQIYTDDQGVMYAVSQYEKYLVKYCDTANTVTVEEGTTVICQSAFFDNTSIRNVILPEGLHTIEKQAFRGCSKLMSINLPSSLISIGEYAFSASGLYTITIPAGIMKLSEGLFSSCSNLRSVDLPDDLTSIGRSAFQYCRQLYSIDLSDGIVEILGYAFTECKLETMSLPTSLRIIGEEAFASGLNFDYLYVPSSVKSIGNAAFRGIGYIYTDALETQDGWNPKWNDDIRVLWGCNKLVQEGQFVFAHIKDNGKVLIKYLGSEPEVIIPDSVTEIGMFSFSDNQTLQHVVLADSVIRIGEGAFSCCMKLSKITWGTNLRYIGSSAFSQNSSLHKIVIPEGVEEIGSSAFSYCMGLEALYIPDTVVYVDVMLFKGTYQNLMIYCEAESLPLGWSEDWFESIQADNIVWNYKEYVVINTR